LRDLDLVQVQHYASSRTDFFLNNLRALLPLAGKYPLRTSSRIRSRDRAYGQYPSGQVEEK
jgi:hypothetical protein